MKRGADVSSDQYLVTAHTKLKLRRAGPSSKGTPRFDVCKLKDPAIKKKFTIQLRNRYQALTNTSENDYDHKTDINKQWAKIMETYNEISNKIIGDETKKHKERITMDGYRRINNTKSARFKQDLQIQYQNINKRIFYLRRLSSHSRSPHKTHE